MLHSENITHETMYQYLLSKENITPDKKYPDNYYSYFSTKNYVVGTN